MRYLLPLFCLIVACGGSAEEKKIQDPEACEKIKTGKFQVATPAAGRNWTIFRTESQQEEINNHTSETVTYSVTWKSACEYELRYLFTSPVDTTHDLEARRKEVVTVSVSNVNNNFYDYTLRKSTDTATVSGRIKILRNDH